MVHQYTKEERVTAVQKKYFDNRQKANQKDGHSPDQEYINAVHSLQLKKLDEEPVRESMKPNHRFVNSYNVRELTNIRNKLREQALEHYDESGFRLARIWDNYTFRTTHDPLGIYKKKGNYEDLAWKVFRNLDEKNLYLKTLYYPRLRREDYINLLNLYNEKSANYNRLKWLSYGLVIGTSGFAWGLALRNNLRFSSFVLLTGGSFVGLKWLVDRYLLNNLNNNLNRASIQYTNKYPEIKYLTVEYVKSPTI